MWAKQMILRRRLKGDIVFQFESFRDEIFVIPFREVKKIEKDLKSEHTIRFTLDRYFNSEFVIKVGDRKRVMAEIKKYWSYFVESRGVEKLNSQDDDAGDLLGFEKIKQILFN